MSDANGSPVPGLDTAQVVEVMHAVSFTGLRGLVALLMRKLDNDGLTTNEGVILEFALQESLARLSMASS